MTNEGKRNLSRVEFDNTYFAIDDDIERLEGGISYEMISKLSDPELVELMHRIADEVEVRFMQHAGFS